MVLAVHEALVNADRHGGGVRSLEAFIDGDTLVVVVCDGGPGFEIPSADLDQSASTVDPFAEDGRGLWLICQIASQAETGRQGRHFCLRMRFEPPGGRVRR